MPPMGAHPFKPPALPVVNLTPALPSFQKRYPDIVLRIEASDSLADFNSDMIDVAVRIGLGMA